MLFQPSSPSRAMLWLLRFFLSLLLLHLATAKGLCEIKNGDCQHFCNVVLGNVECSCADGYFLASDDKSCESNEPFKCGVIVKENNGSMTEENITLVNQTDPDNSFNSTGNYNLTTIQSSSSENSSNNRILQVLEEEILSAMATKTHPINGDYCPPGDCPWQALLLDQDNRGFCGGTILNEYIILTAAHCMNESRLVSVRLELNKFDSSPWLPLIPSPCQICHLQNPYSSDPNNFKNFQNDPVSRTRLDTFQNSFQQHSKKMAETWYRLLRNKGVMTGQDLHAIKQWIDNEGYRSQNDTHGQCVSGFLERPRHNTAPRGPPPSSGRQQPGQEAGARAGT